MNPKPSPEPLPLIPSGLSVEKLDKWIKAAPELRAQFASVTSIP